MKTYSVAVAARELRQILSFEENWSPQVVKRAFMISRTGVVGYKISDSAVLEALGLGEPMFFAETQSGPAAYRMNRPDANWIIGCSDERFKIRVLWGKERELAVDHRQLPETVKDFGEWWDGFKKPCYFYFPEMIAGAYVTEVDKTRMPISNPRYLFYTAKPESNVKTRLDLGLDFQRHNGRNSRGDSDFSYLSTDPARQLVEYFGEVESQSNRFTVDIPVVGAVTSELSIATLSSHFGVKEEPFNSAFRDLVDVANSFGTQGLKVLNDDFSKVEPSDTPVFEAFGIKFPSDLATIGGCLVLLSAQIYFLLYLRKLSGTLKRDDPGWDVPWIGMDESRWARVVLWMTIVLLPTISMAALMIGAAARITRGYWQYWGGKFNMAVYGLHWTIRLKLVLLCFIIEVCFYLGMLCWKYRPKLSEAEPGDPLALGLVPDAE